MPTIKAVATLESVSTSGSNSKPNLNNKAQTVPLAEPAFKFTKRPLKSGSTVSL